MPDSNLDHLLWFCAGWWVFATIAAFLAAMLFWNKGASQLSGQAPGMSSMAVKLGGASAIWGFTLLVFFFVNPARTYNDAKELLLVTTTQEKPAGPLGPRVIEVQNVPGVDFGSQSLSLELIPRDSVFTLMPEGNRFAYWRPIPAGVYELRLTDTKTGFRKSQQLRVAPAGP
ncbi:MAG TPA: hypothetical protein VF173_35745 [Thermoanaerobaculia bacterium]|nr:hypothetical protein [Thermoanaerobaculia bacterium]